MRTLKIYTCGKMSGTSYEEQMQWRRCLENCVQSMRCKDDIRFVHPPLYFNYEYEMHKSEREILEWEISQIYDCDIVVVDLHNVQDSTGSHMELGAVQAINRFCDKKNIYIVGYGDTEECLHPWIKESCIRIENNIEDVARYIIDYLVV